ncbi:MAG: lysophospholipid acyltransferase family protein [Minicystis sp.]
MIPARKQRLFNAWFAGNARDRIHKAFGAVRIHGLAQARALAAEGPLLAVSNHTSWWDPLLILHLTHHLLEVDGYALMEAKNLQILPFFALVGAFGVNLDRPADGAAAMKYAARLLDRPGRLVWIFPQGRERPTSERPLGFRVGSAQIARVARRAVTIPVGIRYEFAGEERPFLYVSLGEALAAAKDPEVGRAAQEAAVEREMDRIERAVRGDEGLGFEEIHRAPEPALGALATRLLATLTAPRQGRKVLRSSGDPRDR